MKLCKRSHIPGQNKIKQNKKKQAKNKKKTSPKTCSDVSVSKDVEASVYKYMTEQP